MATNGIAAAHYGDIAILIAGFFRGLDEHESGTVLATLTSDATWLRQGKLLEGRDAIDAEIALRDPKRRTCHVVSNLMLEEADDGWVATYYVSAYVSREDGPLTLTSILLSRDRLALTPDGPRIADKRSRVMMRAGQLPPTGDT